MSASRVRQLRQYLALQEEIARRLNRPIDLDRATLDMEDMRKQAMLDNQNSLIPLTDDILAAMYPDFNEPSLVDMALRNAQRQSIQDQMEAAGEGYAVSGPMIASVTQLDR